MDTIAIFEFNDVKFTVRKTQNNCFVNGECVNERLLNQTLSAFLRAADEIEYMKSRGREADAVSLAETPALCISKNGTMIEVRCNEINVYVGLSELLKLKDDILTYFQNAYPINFRYADFDAIYFSLFLYEKLPELAFVEYDSIELDALQLLRKDAPSVPITESESYKALLKGVPCTIYTPFRSNHVVDSDYQRLMESMESIQKHGYPMFNRYITLYNDEVYVRDGQHRAAILKYLYGNITVPVIRLFFKEHTENDNRERKESLRNISLSTERLHHAAE